MITIKEAAEILQREYHTDNFRYIIQNILIPDFQKDVHEVRFNSAYFDKVVQMGNSQICEVVIYEVYLNEKAVNKRVGVTQEMFKLLKQVHVNNALISFVNPNNLNYRISLLTSEYVYSGDKIIKVISNPRRYSYSLGYGTKTKTPYIFLISKGFVSNLQDLISRFSIEVINKQFYSEVARHFTKLIGGDFGGTYYNRQLSIKGIQDNSKYPEFAVRLIGRIMFCWFLREKKSTANKPLLPNCFFDTETISKSDYYYHQTLEVLFFELLNTKIRLRKEIYNNDFFKSVPYLNGGLFNPHSDDYYTFDREKGFGRNDTVMIPNQWFNDFFEVLNQYNFVVDENTTYDIELSIDPEMLGRIFENLLAEIIPETGENAKKNTGSFYTPREIVDNMVDTSLISYLHAKTNISEKTISNLVSYAKDDLVNEEYSHKERLLIIDALHNISVLDPACGSGAFPIGMLQKIVYILESVDPDAKLWLDKTTRNVSHLFKKEIEKKFSIGSLNYIRKLAVIQNSIFGIDIQPIAVEISRLRCFLSLIIEDSVNDDEPNRGINSLPNLDFKFIIANSLINLDDSKQTSIFENLSHIEELKEIRDEYFNADYERRLELKIEFIKVQQKMLLENINDYKKNASIKYNQLASWKPFSDESTDWFNSEWMFGIGDGFDIVIGNPPYIDSETMTKIMKGQREKYVGTYKVAKGNWDIFLLFIELGAKLLRENGCMTYIVPNKLIAANYAKAAREYMAKYDLVSIRDYSSVPVFSASVYPIVFLLTNRSPQGDCHIFNMKSLSTVSFERLIEQQVLTNGNDWDTFFAEDSIATEIVKKMKIMPKIESFANVKGASTVGEAYEIKDYIIEEPYDETEHLCFINTGTIDRYKTTWAMERTQYLKSSYYRPVINRDVLERVLPNRYMDAIGEKIIIGGMCKYIEAYYDEGKCVAGKSTIVIMDCSIDIKYIYGVLNSKLMSVYYATAFNSLSLAGGYYRFGPPQIKQLPLPSFSKENQNTIESIINLVGQARNNFSEEVEKNIDYLVYKLFNLTDEEIQYVESVNY
ncbi:MAG: TaqI-like C-terminal specificity domain-containing protein [Acholeplasmataceae bacterium]|jgi:hypothetical protein